MSEAGSPFAADHYDAVVAGIRCAGASIAMLLARRGLRVLAVDPVACGSDTLSTHALMRGAVLQLHRWGLLEAVRSTNLPAIRTTTFHYDGETIEVPIKPRDGVDALFAPRRTILDPLLAEGARSAGAELAFGYSITDVTRDSDGRVRGVSIAGPDRRVSNVSAGIVIGADGIHSKVARLLGVGTEVETPHAAVSIYGYWQDVGQDGFHWFYKPGVSIGTIPTNDGDTCVFALIPQSRFFERRQEGLMALLVDALASVSPQIHERVASTAPSGKLRGFAGQPGFLRRASGPGWVLVGDAGYFRDPITAHGITDALREAELVSNAITKGEAALSAYGRARDQRVSGLLEVTDRIASFDWTLEEVKEHHLELNRQMKAEVEVLLELGPPF